MLKNVRANFCAAALLAIFSLACIPLQAFAQLPCLPLITCPSPDTIPPTVSITSPASGATVSGTISINATASDDRGVAGVQFRVNGADFAAEDTTAPYSISVDTTTASNGSYTLTAVARDAAGNRTTSAPVTVTVSNAPSPPTAVKRYEETDASVSYSAGWLEHNNANDWLAWSGGSMAQSAAPGAQATFTFTGTSVTWIGYRSLDSGIAHVFVDGVFVTDVDLYAKTDEVQAPAFKATGLGVGNHTLTIQVTGLKNAASAANWVVVDAFDVPGPLVSHLQDTDPAISYTAGWTGGDISKDWSGKFAALSTTSGAQATLTFNGTSISWIGYRGPDAGIARVFVDGSLLAEVDAYLPAQRVQDTLFTATGLADTSHTLTIEVTGLMNAASTGTLLVLDAFDVTSQATRFEETDGAVVFVGNWVQDNRNRAWSMGTAANSLTAGAQVTLTFTGTSVNWLGLRGPQTGIARVFVDGSFFADVDTYSPTEAIQDTVFAVTGLAAGSHTFTIEVTGQKNAASRTTSVVVDAFDVRP